MVEATSGNTGIGLAMVCAAKGYPLVVTMADSFSVERRQLMRFLGAKVVLTPRALKGYGMYMKAKELADKHGWFLARQFETPANADIHESTTAQEIIADFAGERLDYFVSGYGTGGTVAGVGRVLKKTWPEAKIVLSEPANAQLVELRHPAGALRGRRAGGRALGLRAAPDPGLDAGLHPAGAAGGDRRPLLRRADPDPGAEGMKWARELAAKEGIFTGVSGGSTFGVAMQVAEKAPAGIGDPRDAARHRRALSLDAALRAVRRRR